MRIIRGTAGSRKTQELCRLLAQESKKGNKVTLIQCEKGFEEIKRLMIKEDANLDNIKAVKLSNHEDILNYLRCEFVGNLVGIDSVGVGGDNYSKDARDKTKVFLDELDGLENSGKFVVTLQTNVTVKDEITIVDYEKLKK